jgi:hypothetical protein
MLVKYWLSFLPVRWLSVGKSDCNPCSPYSFSSGLSTVLAPFKKQIVLRRPVDHNLLFEIIIFKTHLKENFSLKTVIPLQASEKIISLLEPASQLHSPS